MDIKKKKSPQATVPAEAKTDTGGTITETKLQTLIRGLLIMNVQEEMSEPGYTPIDRISFDRNVFKLRQAYAAEIERVINEAKLTIALQEEIDKEKKLGEKTYQPEDIILYYNGIFLGHVHQLKDKIVQLVYLLCLDLKIVPNNLKKEIKEAKVLKVISRHEERLRESGIIEHLQEWTTGNLKVALDKRTNHHHRVSTLSLNEDLQKIRMSRFATNPATSSQFSEYGKKKLAEIGEVAMKKWKEEQIQKQQNTIQEIEQNVEKIAEKIIDHFNVPTDLKVIAESINEYTKFLSSMDVKNEANKNKINPGFQEPIDNFLSMAKEEFGEKLKIPYSVYLVGSVGRDEFIIGSSDINLYFIIDSETNTAINRDDFPFVNIVIVTKQKFLSEEYKKDRFICWSDGVLLFGEEIKFNKEEFPKPGIFLSLLLNRNYEEKLLKVKEDAAAVDEKDFIKLRHLSLTAAKIMLDFDFGVAMANKPFYSASRKKKIEFMKESQQHNRTITLESLYYQGKVVVKKEDFPMLIDTFLNQAKPNFEKLLEFEKLEEEEKSK